MTQIWITGASSGIGQACAEAFAVAGNALTLFARRKDRLEQVRQICLDRGASEVRVVALDLLDWPAVYDWWQALPESDQAPDILVQNAGLARGRDPIQSTPLPTRDGLWTGLTEMIDTNFKTVVAFTQLILPGMIARQSGHIVHLGSIAGHETYPGGHVYSATKHAIRAWSKSLRIDLMGMGIRVTSIDPGMVETEFSQVRFYGDTTKAKNIYAGFNPLRPEDVAACIKFATQLPAHVCIEELVVMPTAQGSANHVHRHLTP